MAERYEQALAIDVGVNTVRGIVLTSGAMVVAGGYAQLALGPDQDPAVFAARIAAALDPDATLPAAVCFDSSHGPEVVESVVAAVSQAGFAAVRIESRDAAQQRANPSGAKPAVLAAVDIPDGLLASHDGLTLDDLLAVTGAGLGLLLGRAEPAESVPVPAMGSDAEPSVTVWSPDLTAPAAADIDPFTSAPIAAAASPFAPDDELTIPADRSNRPAPVTTATAAAASAVAAELPSAVEDHDTEWPPAVEDDDTELPPAVEDADTASAEGVDETAPVLTAKAGPDIDRYVVATVPAPGTPENGPRRLLPLAIAALAIALIAGLAISQCGGDSSDDIATTSDNTPTSVPDDESATDLSPAPAQTGAAQTAVASVPAPTEVAEPTPEPTPEPAATEIPTPEPTPEPTADPLEGLPPLSSLPERGAVFRPPTLFLEGPVQNQEQADGFYAAAIAVVGPDNVVNNYVVRPDAPPATDGNVRVEQAVLFETGSAAIVEQFVPTLELGVAVMALNPQVQMIVEGHTDSVGSDETNLALSKRRAEAVVDYLVSRGVDRDRLEAIGRGEAAPVASNDTADGRQINRRIEVTLLDLLATE